MKNAIELTNINVKYKFVKNVRIRNTILDFLKRNRVKRIEEVEALKGISLSIEHGETVGIIGPNGAGKSTLLKVIGGIFQPDSGDVNVSKGSISLLTLGTGFQASLSGIDNIYLNGLLLGLTKKEIDSKLNEIIEFSGIGEFVYKPIKSYSSGMKSRLAFSIAANIEPSILLIDEVLGVGDQEFKIKSKTRIKEMINSDRTVIIVSHSMGFIKSMCDKVIWLEKGKLIEYGETAEVVERYLSTVNK